MQRGIVVREFEGGGIGATAQDGDFIRFHKMFFGARQPKGAALKRPALARPERKFNVRFSGNRAHRHRKRLRAQARTGLRA